MANFGFTFDASTVQPSDDLAPLPTGEYNVMIIASEMKPTKTGLGQYLELTMQVLDGACINRLIWARLNLVNQNQTAMEIAQRELSAICHAVGVLAVQDSEQLHNIPLKIRVVVKSDQQYGDRNEIKAYKPMNGGQPQATPGQQAVAARQANPWQQPAQQPQQAWQQPAAAPQGAVRPFQPQPQAQPAAPAGPRIPPWAGGQVA